MNIIRNQRGFTLIEMVVSIGLFTIVLFIATSAFLSIVNADRKSRPLRIATDNLNLALEDMTRRIKTGSGYYCGTSYVSGVQDCISGGNELSFIGQETFTHIFTYKKSLGSACGTGYGDTQGCIIREVNGSVSAITSPEINITTLQFFVKGSAPALGATPEVQPTVLVVIDGIVGDASDPAKNASFKIQSMITQRMYDN